MTGIVMATQRWGGPGEERRSGRPQRIMSRIVMATQRWGGPGEERRSLPPGT